VAAAGAAFSVLLPLHMVDNLWNAMLNPIFVLVIGALMGLGASVRRDQTQAQSQGFTNIPQPMAPRPAVAMVR
jgi:fumarate reductase subunit D